MRSHQRALLLAIVTAGTALWATACGRKVTRALVAPTDVATLDERSPYLKAHRADGHVYVLSQWRTDASGTRIEGNGTLLDPRREAIGTGPFSLDVDSIALFETNVAERSGAATALTVMAGITAAVAGICLSDPKTCFGSCPTFYAPDADGKWRIQAETFSASIAPALEATDVDQLLQATPSGRDFRLKVTNEALETHVIRSADLLAVPRPENGRVFRTSDGVFHVAHHPAAPDRCIDAEGTCLPEVSEVDGLERRSLADSTDLGMKETVVLEFDAPPDGELGMVLVTRQTLLTTFLLYQTLAWMGEDATRWLASLEAGDPSTRARIEGIGGALGDIEVQVPDGSGGWRTVGHVGETGPIAQDTRVVPLPDDSGSRNAGPFRVRLRMTQGMWRIDAAQLVTLGPAPDPVRLRPVAVRDTAGNRVGSAVAALNDPEGTLVTLPRDEYEIEYRLPQEPARYELFLEARGYYLEWMRSEWLAEEDPLRAAQVVLNPAQALRDLAPAFKAREPYMENLFWNSRYVRQ